MPEDEIPEYYPYKHIDPYLLAYWQSAKASKERTPPKEININRFKPPADWRSQIDIDEYYGDTDGRA